MHLQKATRTGVFVSLDIVCIPEWNTKVKSPDRNRFLGIHTLRYEAAASVFSLGAGGKCWAPLRDSLIPTWAPVFLVSPLSPWKDSPSPLILSNREYLSRAYFPWFSTLPGPAWAEFRVYWWHRPCFAGNDCLRTTLQVRRSLLFEAEKGKGGGKKFTLLFFLEILLEVSKHRSC